MASADDVSRWQAKLERRPPGHDVRDIVLANLARALYERFEKERKIDDLNEAITFHRAALELRPLENDNGLCHLAALPFVFRRDTTRCGYLVTWRKPSSFDGQR